MTDWEEKLDVDQRAEVIHKRLVRSKAKEPLPEPLFRRIAKMRFEDRQMMRAAPYPGGRWNIPMALAWIVWRGHGYAARYADKVVSARRMALEIADSSALLYRRILPTFSASRKEFVAAAAAGQLTAYAVAEGGGPRPIAIPVDEWA